VLKACYESKILTSAAYPADALSKSSAYFRDSKIKTYFAPMLTLTIAYSTDDQTTAHRIAGDLASHVSFQHVTVGRANEGPVLADLLRDREGRMIILISDDFLTNPNCMLRGHEIFGSNREVLPIMVRSQAYDELRDELTTTQTSLGNQAEVMRYVNHWQDRYIDLRRDAAELAISGGESFQIYLRKIRETSVQAEELLHLLKDSWTLNETQFSANQYQQLFIFTERPQLWEEFRNFDDAPIDLSGVPGLEMLGVADKEARPQVPGEPLEEQSPVPETPEPVTPKPDPAPETSPPMEQPTAPVSAQENTISAGDGEMTTDEQVNTWIERAWSLHDAGDAPSALELLNAGRDALPDELKLHYHYALILATSTEDAVAAQREVEALLDKHPDHNDGLYLNGELALAAGNPAKARESWEQLSDLEPFYPDLNYRLGALLADYFPEDALDAAAFLRRATKNKAPLADACYRYALLLAGPLEKRKKAIKVLRQAVRTDPNHAFAHYELSVLLHAKGEYDAARNAFATASRLNPAFDTAANREAFASVPLVTATTPAEVDALAALRQNLASLEAMLAERDAAPEPEPVKPPGKGAGKTVLISGASSGIGRATARRLAAEDFRLIVLGRRLDRLEELARELRDEFGSEIHPLQLDITQRGKVLTAIESLPPEWCTIDVLINNAGKARGVDPIQEGDLDHWEEMIDVNLKGLLFLTRAVSPRMVYRQSGFILNVASTAGKEVYPNGNVYCATKHAVDALTHSMRLDLVQYGIRVGQICPAMVEETEFSLVRYSGDAQKARIYEDFQPLRSPDVAEAIHFMVTQPAHVNILDLVLQGTQQASSTVVHRSGREQYRTDEEE